MKQLLSTFAVLLISTVTFASPGKTSHLFNCTQWFNGSTWVWLVSVKTIHTTEQGATTVSDWINVAEYSEQSQCVGAANNLNN